MGTHKQELLEKARKAKKDGPVARQQLRRDRALAIADVFSKTVTSLFDLVADDWLEFRELRIYIKPDNTPLALLKVRTIDGDYIAFGTGDDLFDALIGLDSSIGAKGLTEDKGWKQNKRSKK